MAQWQDSSEIVGGLLLKNKININAVRPSLLFPPINEIAKCIKSGVTEVEELIEHVGLMPIQACLNAVDSINGLGDANWISILEQSASSYQAGQSLEKLARKLQRGEQIDWSKITDLSARAQRLETDIYTPLSEITPKEVTFIKSGWEAFDKHLGGIPEVGMTLLAGNPKSGKTWAMSKLIAGAAKIYPDKVVAVHTLEMLNEELAGRLVKEKLSNEQMKRVLLRDMPDTIEEVLNKAATTENLRLLAIDFADLLIRGETSESSMAHIYRTCMLGAKQLRCSILLVSQLNRQYQGGIPRPFHIRYTGLAEALAWLILMTYNPNVDYFAEEDEDILPIRNNVGYICVWASRGGFRKHEEESPGAIAIPFRGRKGWGNKGRWFSLRKA